MTECNHDCASCQKDCKSRTAPPKEKNANSNIRKVIGVISGKGGVGKSLTTSLLAINMARKGYRIAVLDADITGPSIPTVFGIKKKAEACELGIFPALTKTSIKVMSINLLLEQNTDPVIWRGPVLSGTVKQFWRDVLWDEVDYMFIDMPPGTGDVPLTVFQSLPVDGVIIVTSPQELVSMIVVKAIKMAEMMNVPVLGIVENMSYFECSDCKKQYKLFGDSDVEKLASEHKIPMFARIPINPKLASACDKGMLELYEGNWLDDMAEGLEKLQSDTKS
jgi:Mrp family chromosome partitioning ATPase